MIVVEKLTTTYRNGKGIFDVSFSVNEGEAFGYLGPNGAGKTTTIRQIMGFTNADRGACTVNGLDCRREAREIQRTLGYLPGEISFFEEMTGTEFLRFMSGMRGTADRSRTVSLLERFELDPDQSIRRMSKGMKQKVGIVTAFMHDPATYILDEPTSGLDPLMQKIFIDLILEEKARGKTILMSSHNFDEIERTSDRAGVIREGRLIAVEDVGSLKASQRKTFVVTLAAPEDTEHLRSAGLEIGEVRGNQVEVVVSMNYDQLIAALGKCRVEGLDVLPESLEKVFMKYYGQEAE